MDQGDMEEPRRAERLGASGRAVDAQRAHSPAATFARRAGVVALVAAALALTIFPFDWLSEVWPAYRAVFDQVFVTARDHAIGHATLFCLVGLAVLVLTPALRSCVWGYLGLGLLGALAQEAVQALAKQDWPNWGDGRDILFDVLGLLVAFALVQFILWVWRRAALNGGMHARP